LEAIKTKKGKYDYLKNIFIEAGFPKDVGLSIASCKRFKESRDRAKEIAELDLGNIISDRKKRSTRSDVKTEMSAKYQSSDNDSDSDDSSTDSSKNQRKSLSSFSRIADLVESDSDNNDDNDDQLPKSAGIREPSSKIAKKIESSSSEDES
jgi:hypothetical protein